MVHTVLAISATFLLSIVLAAIMVFLFKTYAPWDKLQKERQEREKRKKEKKEEEVDSEWLIGKPHRMKEN